jgi:hypothetical protein
VVAFGPSIGASAQRCPGESVREVTSLDNLPRELRALLPRDNAGLDGIADRGRPFNATDVVLHDLPRRRFTLAAVSSSCAVIAVQYGGIATGFTLTEYHLVQNRWLMVSHTFVFREPRSATDLLTLP